MDVRPGERWYRRLLRLYPKDFRDEFGGEMTAIYRDRRREERGWTLWVSVLLDLVRTAPSEHLAMFTQDLRHAWRALRRTPIVTTTAMLTLALGVGASTTVFSVVQAVLLRPLPYPDPDRLVELYETNLAGSMRPSALNYLSWTERAGGFEALAAFSGTGATLTSDGADPERLNGSIVTASLFDVLALRPILGRPLQAADEQRGAPRVVVLGEGFWRTRFAGDLGILDRSITLDGQRYRIVGVMPRAFREVGRAQATATAAAQFFLPMSIDPAQEHRANHTLRVVGRLRRGVSLEQARAEMHAIGAALAREFPATNTNWNVGIDPLADTTVERTVYRALLLVFGAVTMVLLIACANVANLMLARGTRRHAELAVRAALGAGRSRLVRQLLTESGCLAAVSGAAGVLVAIVAQPLVRALLPPTLPRLEELRLDVNVLAFGLIISMASGLLSGIAPALRAARLDPSPSLMLLGRATADPSRARVRQMLTAIQIGVATMLLIGAALLLQAFVRLQRVPLGFDPTGVVTARLSLPASAYPDADRTGQFYTRLAGSVHRPLAVATSAPFAPGVRATFRRATAGRDTAGEDAAEHIVNGEYFRMLRIPLLAGRVFTERDTLGAAGVAVVSQRVARLFWPEPGTNPLGQLIERGGRSYEVIGIVGDVRGSDTQGMTGGGPDREPRAAVYFAASQLPQRTMTLLLRPDGASTSVIADLRRAVRELDPTVAVQQVRPLSDWLGESLAPTRLTTRLAIVFAASALLLASVGIYGVLAYSVASRTREIGVRLAIGATRARVMGLVLREGMTWAIGGIVAGLIGAFVATRVMATLLFDVSARDPITFTGIAAAVTMVACLACTLPALRAVRIDPTVALRTE